jgi:hypothetical protein
MLAGRSTIAIAVGALIQGPAVIRAWLDRQVAESEEAQARAQALREDADHRRLKRRRTLLGWSPGTVETYTIALPVGPLVHMTYCLGGPDALICRQGVRLLLA